MGNLDPNTVVLIMIAIIIGVAFWRWLLMALTIGLIGVFLIGADRLFLTIHG